MACANDTASTTRLLPSTFPAAADVVEAIRRPSLGRATDLSSSSQAAADGASSNRMYCQLGFSMQKQPKQTGCHKVYTCHKYYH